MPAFHVDSIQHWEAFEHDRMSYDLGHLDSHEVFFQKEEGKEAIRFVVTYGLHCFTKDGTEHNIPLKYPDGRECQFICLERYEASKQLRGMLEKLAYATVYLTQGESFFTLDVLNNASGEVEPFKICMAIFRENRVLRIHVTSAFFARLGEGAPGVPVKKKGFSIFKVAADTQKSLKGSVRKRSEIGTKNKTGAPETANPSLGGILSRRCACTSTGQVILASRSANWFPSDGVRSFRIPVTTLRYTTKSQ